MRSPRLRDGDVEYDPETGERVPSHEAPPDDGEDVDPDPVSINGGRMPRLISAYAKIGAKS